MQRQWEAFTTAFTTERERGDNLSLLTAELCYVTMDSRAALLLSSTDIFHTCKIILSFNRRLSSLESPVIAPGWHYSWPLHYSEVKFHITDCADRPGMLVVKVTTNH